MEKYIVIKGLPDAHVGTEVDWNEKLNCYQYKKSESFANQDATYLTQKQIVENSTFFCKATEYPEYFAYWNPVYTRKDVLDLIKVTFQYKNHDTYRFEAALRSFGKEKAEKILNQPNTTSSELSTINRLIAEKIILALDDYGRKIDNLEYGLPIDPDTKSFEPKKAQEMLKIVIDILSLKN